MKNSNLKKALANYQKSNTSTSMNEDFEVLGDQSAYQLNGGAKCPENCFVNLNKKKAHCFVNRCKSNCSKNKKEDC